MFKKMFSTESPLPLMGQKLFNLVMLSILWCLSCIPIITIGPACTALYDAVFKTVRKDRGYMLRSYVKSFKNNFRKSCLIGVMYTILLIAAAVDMRILKALTFTWAVYAQIILLVLVLFVSLVVLYALAYTARFEQTAFVTLANAFFISIRHLPQTVLILVIVVLGFILTYMMPPAVFVMPGLTALGMTFVFESIFRRYMSPEDLEKEEQKDRVIPDPY